MTLRPRIALVVDFLCGVFFSGALMSTAGYATTCRYPGDPTAGLEVRDGFAEFLAPATLKPFKEALPRVADNALQAALQDPDAMWYDEHSMVYGYQDSIEFVVGMRSNCVGREIAERNQGHPGIDQLIHFFGPDERFTFPFRTVAGTEAVTNLKALNFWLPPKRSGKVIPVRYWRSSSRGRWFWSFPIDTLFGEVLFEKAPDDRWYVFEIRTRRRYDGGWAVDVFRPFPTAKAMAAAVKMHRPAWASSPDLKALVTHLEDKSTLVKRRWESEAFSKVFPAIDGAVDPLPEIPDSILVMELLTQTPFVSVEGAIWKENAPLETYAPSSVGEFSVVPKGYDMGMIPVNEVSCNRCHSETGHRIGDFNDNLALYGEVWGEERIFTWHLFEPHERIYSVWDDAQGSRTLNPRLEQAGLVASGKPAASEKDYNPLPSAFNRR